jgi:hypothetical protein
LAPNPLPNGSGFWRVFLGRDKYQFFSTCALGKTDAGNSAPHSFGGRGFFPFNQCICLQPDKINPPALHTGVCGTVVPQETFIVNSEQARQQAEKRFNQEERARDGRKATIEYEAEAIATREKTARLRALRLAKEAEAQSETPLPKLARHQPMRRDKR